MLHKIKLLFVLLFSFTLFSCSDSILNVPEAVQNESSEVSKLGTRNFTERDNPPATVTKTINGKHGGEINLSGIYLGLDLRLITINAKLTIPPAAFEGTREITLTADWDTPGIICEPAMEFDTPLTLDLSFLNIDILGLLFNPQNISFAYLGDDGTVKPCENEGIDLDILSGLLGVHKAKIEHFSRYGFSR